MARFYAWASVALGVGGAGLCSALSCAAVSGVDQLQKVSCLDDCDASPGDGDAGSTATFDAGGSVDSGGNTGTSESGVPDAGGSAPEASPGSDSAAEASSPAATYRAAVLADSPAGYWRLGDAAGSTTCHDETGNGNDGMVIGDGIALGVAGALFGDTDTAVQFSSGAGVVNLGTSFTFTGNASFTWEVWVKPAALGDGVFLPFLSSMTYTNSGEPTDGTYMVSYSDPKSGDTFGFERFKGSNGVLALDTPGLHAGKWTYVVGAYDGTSANGYVYLDGALLVSGAIDQNVATYAAPMLVGYLFKGSIDEVAIYDHVLTQASVTAHWLAGSQ